MKQFIRVDFWFKKDFKYKCKFGAYKKLMAFAELFCSKVPCSYRFFTFQQVPHFFIEFGCVDGTEKVLRRKLKNLPDFIETFDIVKKSPLSKPETEIEHKALDLFATFIFNKVNKNQHKKYDDFNEEKFVHCLMNMRYVHFAAEIEFCLQRVRALVGLRK